MGRKVCRASSAVCQSVGGVHEPQLVLLPEVSSRSLAAARDSVPSPASANGQRQQRSCWSTPQWTPTRPSDDMSVWDVADRLTDLANTIAPHLDDDTDPP